MLARAAACCAAAVLLGACDREAPVRAYRAPKEVAVRVASTPAAGPGASASAGMPTWTVPAGWMPLPPDQFRKAAFALSPDHPEAIVTVVPLDAEAGGLGANIARWQGQLGLPPFPPAEAEKLATHQDINDLHVDRVDLLGPETPPPPAKTRQRMLAAIIPSGGKTWFFKLTAPADVAEAQKANFDAFVNSIRFGASENPAAAVADGGDTRNPAPPPPSESGNVAAAPARLTWGALPPGWTAAPAPQPPRVATIKVEGSGGSAGQQAELAVTKFPGTAVGSFGDNINRWRGQLGLAPAADTSAYAPEMLTLGGEQWAVVEVVGEDNPGAPGSAQRILVGMTTPGGQAAPEIWFFKLQGPSKLVAEQRPAFEKFIESVKFTAE